MKPCLKVKNLNVLFKRRTDCVHPVRGVDFTLYEGEMLAIVGESGCGKSVMAKSLLRLLPKDSCDIFADQIEIMGRDIIHLSKKEFKAVCGQEIAMIFQDPMTSLNPTMKIGKQIGECLKRSEPSLSRKAIKGRVQELLELVRLPSPEIQYDKYPFELSGGMRQRVAIAMALAFSPKIIIADEPTTALDVTIQAGILKLMKDIQEQTKTSIILITHDLSLVARYCNRALVMYAGNIVERATTEELFYNPKHPYTELLLKSLPRPDLNQSRLTPIDGKPPDLSQQFCGCPFINRCPYAMNICKMTPPKMESLSANHESRCWREHPEFKTEIEEEVVAEREEVPHE